jgi:hypothetical protein
MHKKNLIVLGVAFLISNVFSYSYTTFPSMTDKDVFSVNPVVFADRTGNTGGMELFLYYGLAKNTDIAFSYNNLSNSPSAMLRYDVGHSNNIFSLKATTASVIPQYTVQLENATFYLSGSIASQISFQYAKDLAFFGVVCPGYKPLKWLDIFCEANPGYYLHADTAKGQADFANNALRAQKFDLDIVPGIGLTIGKCLFSIAMPVYNVVHNSSVTFGAWIYYSITSK